MEHRAQGGKAILDWIIAQKGLYPKIKWQELKNIKSFSIEELSQGFHALVDASDPSAPDIPVVRTHLQEHTSRFYSTLESIDDS